MCVIRVVSEFLAERLRTLLNRLLGCSVACDIRLPCSVWDLESDLNIHKQDDSSIMKANSGSYRSENSETLSATSSEGPIVSPTHETV